jgi:uncharacterized protein
MSRYTRLIDLGDQSAVLYNGYTGAVLLFSGEKLEQLEKLWQVAPPGNPLPPNIEDGDLMENLEVGGYIVETDIDELQRIKDDYEFTRNRSRFVLTINPTYSCNLGCDYCFVGKKAGMMTPLKQDQLIEFVRSHVATNKPDSMAVDWMGGEPLLVPKVIEKLSKAFMEICDNAGIPYDAHVITNGTMVDENTPAFLERSGVKELQITLDGPAKYHDVRRYYKVGNDSSFQKILEGMPHLVGRFPIRLRINVDSENLNEVWPLMDLFEEKGWLGPDKHFFPYLAAVEPHTSACAHVIATEQGVFHEVNFAWMRRLLDLGVPVGAKTLYFFPDRKLYNCGAVGNNGFAVTPMGELHKCGMMADNSEEAVGHLGEELDFTKPNLSKWKEYDPFTSPGCCSCEFLPSCLGGCPKDHMEKRDVLIADNCTFHKQFEDRIIAEHVKLLAV